MMKRHTEMRFEIDKKTDVEGNVGRIFSSDIDWKKSAYENIFYFLLLEPKLMKLFKYICKYLV